MKPNEEKGTFMLNLQDIDNIVLNGGIVVDTDGVRIGSVEQIFTSSDSGEPVFVTVRTGMFGMSESFAPLSGARLEESVIRIAFSKEMVKNGPRIDSDRGAITTMQEQELYSYYGLAIDGSSEGTATTAEPSSTGHVPPELRESAPPVPPHLRKHAPVPPPPHEGLPPHLRKHAPVPPPPHGGVPPHHRPKDGPPPHRLPPHEDIPESGT
ncbi:PRC-barrel domain-containing protein [bacterium RCC_150]